MEKTLTVNKVLHTDGSGLWSNASVNVPVTNLELAYVSDDCKFGELRVYFNTMHWDTNEFGLIYTDKLFLNELKILLANLSLSTSLDYSEQGMQGYNYVSFDVFDDFVKVWRENG
jgi:hypothetical protein